MVVRVVQIFISQGLPGSETLETLYEGENTSELNITATITTMKTLFIRVVMATMTTMKTMTTVIMTTMTSMKTMMTVIMITTTRLFHFVTGCHVSGSEEVGQVILIALLILLFYYY